MTAETLKAAARRWILGIWDGGDLGLLDELASSAYSYSAPGRTDLRGEAFEALVREMHSGFPDLRNTIVSQVAEGNRVVTSGITHGTHRGSFAGIAATGRLIEVPWVIITEFDGDRIASDWEIYDSLTVMQQLGVSTAQPQAAVTGAAALEEVKVAIGRMREAVNAGDREALYRITAEDFELMAPGQPAVAGPAAREILSALVTDMRVVLAPFCNEQIVVCGDYAFQRYTYRMTLAPRTGGPSMTEQGDGMHVFHRDHAGSWRLAKDIFTSVPQAATQA